MKPLKRFDEGLARGEAVIATLFLVTMVLAGCAQALMRHFATDWEAVWANGALDHLEWVDSYLQKGTLWLAFLGASLATREGRHIGIDLLPRLAPRKAKMLMRGIAGLGSSVVSFYLARAFWAAVLVNAEERPATMEVFGDTGALHVCDASAAQVANAGLEVPGIFCVVRDALAGIGIPVETPNAALQLIVPAMFVIIAVRLFANGVGALWKLREADEDEVEVAHRKTGAGAAARDEADGESDEGEAR
ncbi:MAG TPA: TRAP transporter small permease subunit [Sandaracinaceae bacterium LLY-WYZ-13_1]|nr:TRAP transporter small permease subunit [Sandaracinaceae bacterium LLY-WYZ-13_1]